MKILFVLPEYYPHSGGGISTYYQELMPVLKLQCTKIKILVGSGYTQSDKSFMQEGIEVEYLKPALYQHFLPKFSKYKIFPEVQKNLAAAWAMWEQAKNNKFDIIECTDFGLGFIPWLINHDRPVTIKMHGSTGQISTHDYKAEEELAADFVRQTELLFFTRCDLLQTYSKANQEFWQKQLPGKEIVHLYPVYNKSSEIFSYNERKTYGLVTGRIQQWKGPQVLCEASEILQASMPEVHWFGRDMSYQKIGISMKQHLAKQYPNSWDVKIKSKLPLPYKEIQGLQGKAKFGLIPSTWDMFNFTCLEFLSAGTLTVCSDGAGSSELIKNGVNGFTYPAQNAQALAGLLQGLDSISQEKYEQMAQQGQKTIRELLSPEVLVPAYMTCYHEAIKKFIPGKANNFMQTVYQPSNRYHQLDELLDLQPLRQLSIYNLKRLKSKILSLLN